MGNAKAVAELRNSRIVSIIVRPGSSKNEITGYDAEREAYRINIAAPPQDNKANRELLKFLTKELKKKVEIKSGLKSKKKIISISD